MMIISRLGWKQMLVINTMINRLECHPTYPDILNIVIHDLSLSEIMHITINLTMRGIVTVNDLDQLVLTPEAIEHFSKVARW